MVRSTADPQFTGSGSLSGVWWTSVFEFTVDNSCISGTGTSSCLISPVLASFTLASSSGGSPNVTGTFPLFAPTTISLHHTGGIVDAFDAPLLGPSALFTDPLPSFTGAAFIDWNMSGAVESAVFYIFQCPSNTNDDDEWSYRKWYSHPTTCSPSLGGAAASTIPAIIQITQVPEPGALVLLLTGLSAFWIVRRRAATRS